MKVLAVIVVDIPDVKEIRTVLQAIDPPSIPFFEGTVHVVPEPHASALQSWLTEE